MTWGRVRSMTWKAPSVSETSSTNDTTPNTVAALAHAWVGKQQNF